MLTSSIKTSDYERAGEALPDIVSVTEAATTQCAQDMLFVMRALDSMDSLDLIVRKPMMEFEPSCGF